MSVAHARIRSRPFRSLDTKVVQEGDWNWAKEFVFGTFSPYNKIYILMGNTIGLPPRAQHLCPLHAEKRLPRVLAPRTPAGIGHRGEACTARALWSYRP